MNKRKPPVASKHARRSKIAAKAQQATQPVIKSPKDRLLRSVAAGSTPSPSEHRNEDPKQEAPRAENQVTALQNDRKAMADIELTKGFDFSSATANVRAYQAKLVEMTQVDMQFAFELAQRLATIRSPVEFVSVIAEFTSKRIFMFRKYANEMVELSTKRLAA
jgi:hypothetical protein